MSNAHRTRRRKTPRAQDQAHHRWTHHADPAARETRSLGRPLSWSSQPVVLVDEPIGGWMVEVPKEEASGAADVGGREDVGFRDRAEYDDHRSGVQT